ncbi:MAG: tRNA (adenosine(37)-N6)-dimethylallyltransferase MiaA [Acidobacteria bacterium]|nr:tRNA (adenosine(37)-N6)-dimethylallyltransferase MiaA [Acidobacteriota bacterium]
MDLATSERAFPLLGVVGPTASGKSALAVELARRFGGEIVNCDSMQVYRGLDVGTAKPDAGLRREIPHHVLDVADVDEVFSAGRYQKLARAALEDIRSRGRLPVVAGGTGFYLRALLYGIFEGPGRDEGFRRRLQTIVERRGPETLHRILARRDPESARRVTPRDHQRLARALEVLHLTGRPMSEHFGVAESPLDGFSPLLLCLGPPRAALCERIDRRVLEMLDAGWVDEVRALLDRGVSPASKGLEAIGYREIVAFLRGEATWLATVEAIRAATRRYAKRQQTWFRKERDLVRLEGFGDDPSLREAAFQQVETRFPRAVPARANGV